MAPSGKYHLIPRNNWDFKFSELATALAGTFQRYAEAPNFDRAFERQPVWTNSGRTSLYVILKSLNLPAGARVGIPLFCCPVVANAVCQAGLTPCFIDSNLVDFNLSVEDLHRKIGGLTAVVVVHTFGQPCDMDQIKHVAGVLPVIEDCAHALYSSYKGSPAGFLATASFFSFRSGKYLSAGEGSSIFCSDPELQKSIEETVNSLACPSLRKMLIQSGLTYIKASLYNRPWYGLLGYPVGMRLDKKLNLTAKDGFYAEKISAGFLALINARIPYFHEKITLQQEHAHLLLDRLNAFSYSLPVEAEDCSSNWFQFSLRFQNSSQRDAMADYLFQQGIDTSKFLDDIVEVAHLNYGYQVGDCPTAETLSKTVLLIPIHYNLRTLDLEHIARSINVGSTYLKNLSLR